ncbi:phosphatase PAP2 family protein [Microbulbifer sp. CAU 1566]|uniref:phosphatase PAP2 family protein n=1 Tax=Microbulbifer sp. CAU 1566 TaxID=2933269 RepID=UPI002003AEF8|nr:phosphatase PAP2 family protein [Microbulbifer sp. CAU 1566]MCK7597009.1 phosphatase PAP2 family protein [Microbulbifer sp. CAU 1566]
MDKQFLARQALLTAIALVCIIALFELTDIDMWFQSKLYQFGPDHWMLDKHNETLRLIFYDGPKNLLAVLVGLSLLAIIVLYRTIRFQPYRRGLLIVLISMAITASLVGLFKTWTDVPCPKDLSAFGGRYPHITFLHRIPISADLGRVRCFPAGHASGGFALLSLFFLFRQRRNRWLGFGAGMLLGWTLGGYKMLIGDHFLSHTLVTMCIAWLVSLGVAACVFRWSRETAGSIPGYEAGYREIEPADRPIH